MTVVGHARILAWLLIGVLKLTRPCCRGEGLAYRTKGGGRHRGVRRIACWSCEHVYKCPLCGDLASGLHSKKMTANLLSYTGAAMYVNSRCTLCPWDYMSVPMPLYRWGWWCCSLVSFYCASWCTLSTPLLYLNSFRNCCRDQGGIPLEGHCTTLTPLYTAHTCISINSMVVLHYET